MACQTKTERSTKKDLTLKWSKKNPENQQDVATIDWTCMKMKRVKEVDNYSEEDDGKEEDDDKKDEEEEVVVVEDDDDGECFSNLRKGYCPHEMHQ